MVSYRNELSSAPPLMLKNRALSTNLGGRRIAKRTQKGNICLQQKTKLGAATCGAQQTESTSDHYPKLGIIYLPDFRQTRETAKLPQRERRPQE